MTREIVTTSAFVCWGVRGWECYLEDFLEAEGSPERRETIESTGWNFQSR